MKKLVALIIVLVLIITIVNLFSYEYIKSNLDRIQKDYAEGNIFLEKNFGLVKTKIEELKTVFKLYSFMLLNKQREELLLEIKIKTIELSEKLLEIRNTETRINITKINCSLNETKKLTASYEQVISRIESLKEKITVFLKTETNTEMQKELEALEGLLKNFTLKKDYLNKSCQ